MSKLINLRKQYRSTFSFRPTTLDTIRLPLLISVPHGGYTVPVEMLSRVSLEMHDIFPDSDPCTQTIYSFAGEALYFHQADIARAVIDVNRADDDLPPRNPDGVIKSHTVTGKTVYHHGWQPDRPLIEKLLEKYYYPYHDAITSDLKDPALLCALDCHSMLEFPPKIAPQGTTERPFICLSNGGDEHGDGTEAELTCTADLINLLADCLRFEFPGEADNIVINQPFAGGHISRMHSGQLPWIQVELSRRAYLREPWFSPKTLRVDSSRLLYLRHKFLQAFTVFCEEAVTMHHRQNIGYMQQPISPLAFSSAHPLLS